MANMSSHVIAIGPQVDELAKLNLLILFSADAPKDLKEFCVVHDQGQQILSLSEGDQIILGQDTYKVTVVGKTAVESYNTIGHVTLKFGVSEAPLSGSIYLAEELKKVPIIGDVIQL